VFVLPRTSTVIAANADCTFSVKTVPACWRLASKAESVIGRCSISPVASFSSVAVMLGWPLVDSAKETFTHFHCCEGCRPRNKKSCCSNLVGVSCCHDSSLLLELDIIQSQPCCLLTSSCLALTYHFCSQHDASMCLLCSHDLSNFFWPQKIWNLFVLNHCFMNST